MRPKIVAFVGAIGSGKTTAARMLAGLSYEKFSFADPLKEMLVTLGLTYAQVYGYEKEIPSPILHGKTPRFAMQTLGTEWGRDLIHRDLWTTAWQYRIQSKQFVAVDDARFPNEFAMLRSLDAYIIKITRPNTGGKIEHESEAYSPPYDTLVFNNSSVSALHKRIIHEVETARET